ncbi:unnamed protein product [Chilo suppressalis]|uniref:Uncharacterized protein n=1 Tax=Chilo suppressalis TaxID=168631 RepID=A0ABN8LA45_CHISP|nr:unnamed protein product [Chilo suppressalis]
MKMSANVVMSGRKKELLAYKEKILKDLEYYKLRTEEARASRSKSFVYDSDSSDSDSELPIKVHVGPSLQQLRQQQNSLRTCLQATEELTGLQVLQSQVNVLTEDPVFEGELPVTEQGVWREVTADCRVDLVLFSISFYVHQAVGQFGAWRYRGLKTSCTRPAHEAEVAGSILATVTTPSDAVEVLKNYAVGHRSRRTTLASLVKKYPDFLHMEPMPEGGYLLKCADLLEVSWTLQNKWSPIAAFHHRMKFDLEYMDECYIKIITQAHRQLSDPTIETDERTMLLSKIISTCLEARGPTQELYESMSSDPETAQSLKNRRTTLIEEQEPPVVVKKKAKEVMAPPKSLPKKAKPKGKENMAENPKRPGEEIDNKAKKTKADGNKEPNKVNSENVIEKALNKQKSDANNKNNDAKKSKGSNANKNDKKSPKNDEARSNPVTNAEENVVTMKNTKEKETTVTAQKKSKASKVATDKIDATKTNAVQNVLKSKPNSGNIEKVKNAINSKKAVTNNAEQEKQTHKVPSNNENNDKIKNGNTKDKVVKTNAITKTDKNIIAKQKVSESEDKTKPVSSKDDSGNNKLDNNKAMTKMSASNKPVSSKQNEIIKTKQQTNDIDKTSKSVKNKVPAKPVKDKINPTKETNKQITDKNKDKNKQSTVQEPVENTINGANLKRKSDSAEQTAKDVDANVDVAKKTKLTKPDITNKATNNKFDKNQQKNVNKQTQGNNLKTQNKIIKKIDQNSRPKATISSMKTLNTGNIQRVFSAGNISKQSSEKTSRIPQKKLSPNLKKNPLRISPRKVPSKFKTATTFGNNNKTVTKTTNIPRLFKNPSPKD